MQELRKNKRTFWPLGILVIILIGVVLISFTIYFSFKNPIINDINYGHKKGYIDENINEFMLLQNNFEKYLIPYADANKKPSFVSELRIYSPYLNIPYKFLKDSKNTKQDLIAQAKLNKDIFLKKDANNAVFLDFKKLANSDISLQDARIVFRRIDSDVKTIIPFNKQDDFSFKSKEFSLPLEGRYEASFEITYKLGNKNEEVYYKHYFFNI